MQLKYVVILNYIVLSILPASADFRSQGGNITEAQHSHTAAAPRGVEANLCDHRLLECLAQLGLEAKLQVCLGSPAAARLGCAVAVAVAGAIVGPPLVRGVICERRKRSGISKTDLVMVDKRVAYPLAARS